MQIKERMTALYNLLIPVKLISYKFCLHYLQFWIWYYISNATFFLFKTGLNYKTQADLSKEENKL